MKTKTLAMPIIALTLLSLLSIITQAAPLGTAFTYQGQLNDGGQPAGGIYDLRFVIYDAASDGSIVAGPITNSPVGVTNGLFTTELDFGAGVFTGDARWLEITVRTNGSTDDFTLLSPRQPLTTAPYAIRADSAASAETAAVATTLAGPLPSDKLVGTYTGKLTLFNETNEFFGEFWGEFYGDHFGDSFGDFYGDGYGITHLNASQLWYGTVPDARLSTNVAMLPANQTFSGSNVFTGTVIATNAANTFHGTFTGDGAGVSNLNGVALAPGTVGNAAINTNAVTADKVASGQVVKSLNSLKDDVVLAAGENIVLATNGNTLQLSATPSATGWRLTGNPATDPTTNFLGTTDNQPLEIRVNGTRLLRLETNASVAAGNGAQAGGPGSFVWADSTAGVFSSTGSNQFLVRATGGVGIGTNNPQSALHVVGWVQADGFSGSGAGLSALNASQLTSGSLPDARLSTNVVLLGSSPQFTGTVSAAGFSGNGLGLTNLDAEAVGPPGTFKLHRVFILASSPSVGAGSCDVAVADVNGDGWLDLISANADGDTLSVLTNDGRGGFALASSPSVANAPSTVVAADVNRDSWVDLISPDGGCSTLSVLTNDGSGGFALAGSPSTGPNPQFLIAADVNRDNWVDLISVSGNEDTLSVLTNDGSGGFALASSLGVGLFPRSVVAADVNQDNWVDLISANVGSNTLSVLTNDGSGGFALASSPSVGSQPYRLAAADVNGDNWVDLISANLGDGTLSVLTNDGSGGFALANSPSVGGVFDIVAADVNQDPWVDLIGTGGNALSVLTNDGSGGFALADSPSVGSPSSVAAADLNQDGLTDLISVHYDYFGGTLSVLFGGWSVTARMDGSFSGDGSGLTGLNASNLTSGTVSDARLSANVARLDTSPTFAGTVTAGGDLVGARLKVGTNHTLSSSWATIAGGYQNGILEDASYASIAGGYQNFILEDASLASIAGGYQNFIRTNTYASTIGGGAGNRIWDNAQCATIGGGYGNNVRGSSSTVSGGYQNDIKDAANYAIIAGGFQNTIGTNADYATIAGGRNNDIATNAQHSAIGGGRDNDIGDNAMYSVIAGGDDNDIAANSDYATIPGGRENDVGAGASYGFAAGYGARAMHPGAFVWSDSAGYYLSSLATNEFRARASGGVYFFSNPYGTVGVHLEAGGNSWSAVSDRNQKENFQPVDPRAVLEKVARLPVTEWNLKSQPASIRHLGPMAQDFKAAFGLGEDDRHISTSDADGVTLAAIQGLDQVVKEKEARITDLEKTVAELKGLVSALNRKVNGGGQ